MLPGRERRTRKLSTGERHSSYQCRGGCGNGGQVPYVPLPAGGTFPAFPRDAATQRDETNQTEERENMPGTVTMYSTTWCGYCRRLKGQMDREGITYNEINIEQDPESAAFVEKANGGNQTVPTVLFSDGSTLTNPSLAQVKQKIGA